MRWVQNRVEASNGNPDDAVCVRDLWYRFRYFVVRVFDFDSQDILFAAGQGRDNWFRNEDKVIGDTFAGVRKALHKP